MLAVWLVLTIVGLIALGLGWLLYLSSTENFRCQSLRWTLFKEIGIPALVGFVFWVVTRHIVLSLIIAGPVWFYGLVYVLDLGNRIERASHWRLKYVEPALFSLCCLVAVGLAVFVGQSGPQITVNIFSLLAGMMVGVITGCLSVAGGFFGSKYRDAAAFVFGAIAWLAPAIGGTLWFETGALSGNAKGLYIVGFLVFCIVAGALTTIVFLRETEPARQPARV